MNDLSPMSLDPAFQGDARAAALEILTDILGTEQAKAAATRLAVALNVLGKRNPDVYRADPQSIGECIAACALSGLAVGGAMPTCYVLPRKRSFKDKNDDWQSVIELNWQLGFRGMISLANRAGFQIQAFPVYPERVPAFDNAGRFVIPTQRLPPVNRQIENLIGVVVKVRRMADGMDFGECFVEADQIEDRRAKSDAWQRGQATTYARGRDAGKPLPPADIARAQSSPWYEWPEEMALKTAVRYACSRGMVPLDDAGQRALEYDGKRDNVIDVPSTVIETRADPVRDPARQEARTGRAALGMDTGPGVQDFAAETARLNREREAVERVANDERTAQENARAQATREVAPGVTHTAPAADPPKPKLPKAHSPADVVARLGTLGVTLELAEAHVATPLAAWTAADVAKLVALGVEVKAGRVKVADLAGVVEGGESDEDGAP